MLKKVFRHDNGIALLIVVIALQPGDYRIARSATIAAPAQILFAQVHDFHNSDGWSPWAQLDASMNTTHTGAACSWPGDDQVGAGRLSLSETRRNELIRLELGFVEPIAANNSTDFDFKPEGDQTQVTWSISGKNNFMSKAFGRFMNMDTMVGGDFPKSLAQLRSLVETVVKQQQGGILP